MNNVVEKEMKIFVPIDIEGSLEKSHKGDDKDWYVKGYASTPALDLQGEMVNPAGIDIGYFVDNGYINFEHRQEPDYVVGVPTSNCYVDFQKGLFVEARLFKDNEHAQSMWKLANSISKTGIDRQLGFSIEGAIRKRNTDDSRIIEEVVIKNVAVTMNPANPEATWETFMKSWTTGHGTTPDTQVNAGALRRESLANSISVLASAYKISDPIEFDNLWKDVSKFLDEKGEYNENEAIVMLQLAKGVSRVSACESLMNRRKGKQNE
ncbi:hypothetical protein [Listeria phage List-36]|uniref:Prohead serine protease domain-containing protein n=21 Tax=Pecentumvirus TaxID=1857844 RepID=A0A5C2IDR1_9CAUD|nr:head maturation protease [Listeria phage A511]YP_007676743.1 head maturation protease [Listeria phage vB_LmoM_AG20]YP_008240064.1 putative prohead protease [Listeria phage LP-125]YP_009042891.1 head maturation protease [Listeria phage LP-048]YP_009043092.1 head maturation protease [Listeria phage LMSP-25]YP_009043468.1 head maturation protease [Listeria phage List-36]YP_009044554.1 head maturation protease [Listeria phage LP-083-2]YP_009055677.1 head maturation protease [Listeria phage LM